MAGEGTKWTRLELYVVSTPPNVLFFLLSSTDIYLSRDIYNDMDTTPVLVKLDLQVGDHVPEPGDYTRA